MKLHNDVNVRIVKYLIEHMRRTMYTEEAIMDTLKEKGYQIETILEAESLIK